jgi:hypothetical protein
MAAPAILLGTSASTQAKSPPRFSLPFLPPPSPPVSIPNPALARVLFHEILDDESAHVQIIQALLDDEANPLRSVFPGTASLPPGVRPMPTLRNIVQPNVRAFITAAGEFENTGSGTYGAALFAIQQTKEYFPTAVGLTTVEARHASWLNTLLGQALVPNFVPVEAGIEQEVTLSRVAPFIAHLVGPTPVFDPDNASDPNNFMILDFLLVLEYIEAAFYQANVPRFFR